MNEIIWTNDELKSIKKIILSQSNLKLNESDMNLTLKSKEPMTSIFINYQEEIINLFYIQDKNSIENILDQASQVKADVNNPKHFGLIMTLSKMNTNDYSQIFEILKQIISQYARITSSIVKEQMKIITKEKNVEIQIKNVTSIIDYLKNNANNIYVNEARKRIDEVFKDANNIEKNEIFNPIIKKLDSELNERFIIYFNDELRSLAKFNEMLKTKDLKKHHADNENKRLKRIKSSWNANPFINK